MESFMEKLREEYKGLGLTDEQIITAKSNNINPEQVKQLREACKNATKVFTEAWEGVLAVVREFTESESFQELLKVGTQNSSKIKRNNKGKKIKPWEKKMFFS